MKFIQLTPDQRALLQALYDYRNMRYLVHDSLGDAAVYTKKPVFDTNRDLWRIDGLTINDVDYISYETVHDLAVLLGVKLKSNPLPITWLAPEDGPVPIRPLLELSSATGVTTMEDVQSAAEI